MTDKAKGADWGKNYIDKMIDDHQKVLDKLQDAAKNTNDADVRSAALPHSCERSVPACRCASAGWIFSASLQPAHRGRPCHRCLARLALRGVLSLSHC